MITSRGFYKFVLLVYVLILILLRTVYIQSQDFLAISTTNASQLQSLLVVDATDQYISNYQFNPVNTSLLLIEKYDRETIHHQTTNNLSVWNILENTEILSRPNTAGVFTPDGEMIVTAEGDRKLRFYDGYTGEVLTVIDYLPIGEPASDLHFHPSRDLLAYSTANGHVYLIDLETESIQDFDIEQPENISHIPLSVYFSLNGHLLVAKNARGVHVWNVDTGQKVITTHRPGIVQFSPDESYMALGGYRMFGATATGIIEIYDTQSGEKLAGIGSNYLPNELPDATYEHCYLYNRNSHIYDVYALAFHPNGDFIAAASGDNVALWDVKTAIEYGIGIDVCDPEEVEEMVFSFTLEGRGRRGDATRIDNWSMTLHPTETLLAFSSRGGKLYLWDFSNPTDIQVTNLPVRTQALTFSPNGQLLITSGTALALWDLDTLTIAGQYDMDYAASRLSFSVDGRYIAILNEYRNSLEIWGIQ